jgi:FkbM family methyltransferase
MAGLYFFGIKKSTIKKLPPFKYLFDWRDRKVYDKLLNAIRQEYEVEAVSSNESIINYSNNNKRFKVYFRHFPSSDISVFNQVLQSNCYLPIIQKLAEHFDASDPVRIVDAGGNVGYADIFFKSYFPNAQIVTIEPEAGNAKQLEKNMSANGFQLKELVQGGLWYRTTYLEVARDFRDNREAAFTVKETDRATGIKGFGFEEILQRQGWEGADFVKIDIEGSERFLFDTEEKADAILQKTKFLAIEIHDEFNIRTMIYEHLKRNGFSFFEFDDLTLGINNKNIRN